jgi:hypothetical protein
MGFEFFFSSLVITSAVASLHLASMLTSARFDKEFWSSQGSPTFFHYLGGRFLFFDKFTVGLLSGRLYRSECVARSRPIVIQSILTWLTLLSWVFALGSLFVSRH